MQAQERSENRGITVAIEVKASEAPMNAIFGEKPPMEIPAGTRIK